MKLLAQKVLDQAFAGDDAGAVDCSRLGVIESVHTFQWGIGVQVGVVEIETAPRTTYTGTWFPVQTVTFDGSATPAPKIQQINITGAYATFRHRISTPVEGGFLTSRIDASGDA